MLYKAFLAVIRFLRVRPGPRKKYFPRKTSLAHKDITVDQVSSTLGKCYTLKWRHGNASNPHMTIVLHNSVAQSLGA